MLIDKKRRLIGTAKKIYAIIQRFPKASQELATLASGLSEAAKELFELE